MQWCSLSLTEGLMVASLWKSMSLCIVLITISVYVKTLLTPWLRCAWFAYNLPGPPALPLIGNALIVSDSTKMIELARSCVAKYGPFIRGWISIMPVVCLTEPAHIQHVLASKRNTNKIFLYQLLHNFIGQGLITSDGAKWKGHRTLIQPYFHINILEKYVETFVEASKLFVKKFEKMHNTDVNVAGMVNDCVLDILNEAVLGIPLSEKFASLKESSPFRKGKVVVPYRITRPWLLFNWIYKMTTTAETELKQRDNLVSFTKRLIREHQEDTNGNTFCRQSLLSLFIKISEQHTEFKEKDIIEEISTFMLAGQDSVGSALAFCLFSLAKHKDAQQKVVDELDAILGQSQRDITLTDLREMRYLEQCVKETLRLYPSVPIIGRKVSHDIKLNDKITVPAGCSIFISPFVTHRLEHIYPEPEHFRPERFTAEEIFKRHAHSFIPFSAGPRNCIGYKFAMLEMKTVLASFLRQYEVSLATEHEPFELMYRITIRAKGGVWLRVNKR